MLFTIQAHDLINKCKSAISAAYKTRCAKYKSLTTSTVLWLILWLVIFDIVIGWIKPLYYIRGMGQQDPLDAKFQALTSPFNHFDVLLMGSSLLIAVANVDFLEDQKNYRLTPAFQTYTKLFSFDQLFKDRLHIPIQSFNMGTSGCMIDEDLLLLHSALEAGKKPKVLILFLAPRDFIDNNILPKTHVFKYLSSRRIEVSMQKSLQENFIIAAKALSNIYRNRGEYMRIVELEACALLHRAPNLYFATKGDAFFSNLRPLALRDPNEPDELLPPKKRREIFTRYYQTAYLPIDYKRLVLEMRELEEILTLCDSNHILLLVINMPRGQDNENILPKDFRQSFMKQLEDVCQNNHVKYINYEGSQQFSADDFSDGVHLLPKGAKKFISLLSDRLAEDQQFCLKAQSYLKH